MNNNNLESLARLAVWVTATIIAVAAFFQIQSFTALFDPGPSILLNITVIGSAGAGVGFAVGCGFVVVQLLIPLRPVTKTTRWALGTMGTWALAGAVYEMLYWLIGLLAIPTLVDNTLSTLVIGAGVGVAFGLGQWLATRRTVRGSQWVFIANLAGWTVGYIAAIVAFPFNPQTSLPFVGIIIALGIIAGLTTGITLTSLQMSDEVI